MKQPSKTLASPADRVRPPTPRTVQIATKLMYAGAALTAVGMLISVIALAVGGSAALKASYPSQTAAQLHTTETTLIVIAVFSGLIEIAIWLIVARSNQGGLKWARIAASVLFALSTWNLVAHLHGTLSIPNLVYTVLIWLVGLGAIVLLWHRESSTYFA
jgi:hypothetical protein